MAKKKKNKAFGIFELDVKEPNYDELGNGHQRIAGAVCPHCGGPIRFGMLTEEKIKCPYCGSLFHPRDLVDFTIEDQELIEREKAEAKEEAEDRKMKTSDKGIVVFGLFYILFNLPLALGMVIVGGHGYDRPEHLSQGSNRHDFVRHCSQISVPELREIDQVPKDEKGAGETGRTKLHTCCFGNNSYSGCSNCYNDRLRKELR